MTRLVLVLAVLAASQPVLAEGLWDVYRLAVNNDPPLQQADADRLAVGELKTQARAALLPSLSASVNTLGNRQDTDTEFGFAGTTDFNSKGYSLSLSQPLYRLDRFAQFKQADYRIEEAEANYAAAEQDLMIRVAERYTGILAAQDSLEFRQSEKKAIGRQLDQTQQRFEVGLIAITDVHEAQAAYDLAVAEEIVAQNGLDNAYERLREIIGEAPGTLATLKTEVPLIRPDPENIEEWVGTAVNQNLQLRAARSASETGRQEIQVQRAGHYPTLDFVVNHDFSETGGSFGSRTTRTSSFGLQLDVPIYSGGGTSSRVREAAHRLDQAQQVEEEQRRSVVRQTRDSYLNVLSDISRVKAFKQALISNESALEATEAGYDVGTRTIVDVLAAQRDLFRARRDYAQSRYDYIVNSLRLKQGAGILSENDIRQIDFWMK